MKKIIMFLIFISSIINCSVRKEKDIVKTENEKCITQGDITLCIPKCKDTNARKQAYEEFENQLVSEGYTIIRSITSETTFNVLVRDNLGLEHWEYKAWCKIN